VPVAATLTAVDEPTLTLTSLAFSSAPRSLAGGRVEWLDGSEVLQTVDIISHSGDSIVVSAWSTDFAIALDVTAYTAALYKTATLTAVAGNNLTAAEFAEFPDFRFAGGYVKWVNADGLVEYRSIRDHSVDVITIDFGALDLAPGLVLTTYPGCKHNWADCGYYENRRNYGGDLWIPIEDPYNGNPIW